MTDVTKLFQQGGGLSDTLSHFELRDGQVSLVSAIDYAVTNSTHLVAEAGTGIGKTFAYLLPTLAQQKQVFVSTATKHLQDQIFFKDLPVIEKVLQRNISACLLKGRSNYFCHYRYYEFIESNIGVTKSQLRKLSRLTDWLDKTQSGDLSEITEFGEDDFVFKKKITSTTENCISGECPYFERCFVQKVREQAKKSEIVIVNHALLMADIVLKETGFAEILPEVDVVVIDEAHHLPKIATQAFAEQISSGQLNELVRDALQIYRQDAGNDKAFEKIVDSLSVAIEELHEALRTQHNENQVRLSELKQFKQAYSAFKVLMQIFKLFLQNLEQLAECSQDLSHIYERATTMAMRIRSVFITVSPSEDDGNTLRSDSVAILEWNADYFRASRLPIYLGYRFHEVMQLYADSWLFVSATLAVGDSFDFFKESLGLPKDIETMTVSSPFDYPNHAVVHIAEQLPAPNHPDFIEQFIKMALPILEKTQGRAFMLFTSYRNLYEATKLIKDSNFNILVQGDLPKAQLIESFINQKNAVLLGTVSFWEGVDIVGKNLSCVIIDKIPFPSPADPIISEQARYMEQQGKNSFAACYIPRAATLLKQGTGRLIRSAEDKGVLVIGDSRMRTKSYGQQLINSLPPARLVNQSALFEFIDKNL